MWLEEGKFPSSLGGQSGPGSRRRWQLAAGKVWEGCGCRGLSHGRWFWLGRTAGIVGERYL